MIAAEFPYLRADTAEEAVDAWSRYKGARYLAGGTEITTSARRTAAPAVTALVDIKHIPEVNIHEMQKDFLILGAALTLADVVEGDAFPFLSATLRGIADHSVRNRLTLGGNVTGMLPYREAVLPLLLADASLQSIAPGKEGAPPVRREQKLKDVFDKRLILAPGELVLSFSVPITATELAWSHHRKTRTGPVDYPLVTSCLIREEEEIRLAISGAHPYPVRSDEVDAALTKDSVVAVDQAIGLLGAFRTDARGSADYRTALLGNMIRASLEELS